MVGETVCKPAQGLENNSVKIAVQYCISFDVISRGYPHVFTSLAYDCKNVVLTEAITNLTERKVGHQNICEMDGGLQSIRNMKAFTENAIRTKISLLTLSHSLDKTKNWI